MLGCGASWLRGFVAVGLRCLTAAEPRGNGVAGLRSSRDVRLRDFGATRLQGYGTSRLRDRGTAGLPYEGLQDCGALVQLGCGAEEL